MSPILQRLMSDLILLRLEEQWQLLSYLVNQLRAEVVEVDKTPSETSPNAAHHPPQITFEFPQITSQRSVCMGVVMSAMTEFNHALTAADTARHLSILLVRYSLSAVAIHRSLVE